jgi:hypothetical protein
MKKGMRERVIVVVMCAIVVYDSAAISTRLAIKSEVRLCFTASSGIET